MLLLYILMIVGVIFLERKSPTEAMLWVLVVACLPYVGIVLYLVFGSTISIKITSCARKKRIKKHYLDLSIEKKENLDKILLSDEDSQVVRFNSIYNNSQVTSYDKRDIYIDGESHYRRLFDDIKNAKKTIYIEFYTIHHDEIGKAFVKALTEKAKQGVDVLVMCDFIANISTPPKMFRPLKEAGGKVIRMKPFLTHYRSHRKIVVIDHEIAYIGGMNIGGKYANMAKIKNPWRDTQVRLVGACALILDEYFLTDWLCSIKRRHWDKTIEYVDSIPRKENVLNSNLCQFIVGGADNDKESVKMCYLSMIRSAKKRIRIQTPYFIPDISILDALKTAAAAGVEIELMIPGIKSSFFLDPVTTYYCGQLLEYGVKIYKYKGYIHAKTMVIDDEMCCIGSVNMDIRSLMVDDEVCGVFYENKMVKDYSEIYDKDIINSNCYKYEEFLKRGAKEKFFEGLFLLFAPLM